MTQLEKIKEFIEVEQAGNDYVIRTARNSEIISKYIAKNTQLLAVTEYIKEVEQCKED